MIFAKSTSYEIEYVWGSIPRVKTEKLLTITDDLMPRSILRVSSFLTVTALVTLETIGLGLLHFHSPTPASVVLEDIYISQIRMCSYFHILS